MKRRPLVTSAEKIVDTVDHTIEHVGARVDALITPVRESAFRRFPILFTLLVTFGAVLTLKGFDLLVTSLPPVLQQPLVMLPAGVVILIFTGTLYKKLG